MSKNKRLLIPIKLQKIKAYQIDQQKRERGIYSDPEINWYEAGEYFIAHPNEILVWKLKNNLSEIGRFVSRSLRICVNILSFLYYLPSQLLVLFGLENSRSFALEIIKTALSLVALVLTYLTIRISSEQMLIGASIKAIEQLNSTKQNIAYSGICLLARIAEKSPSYRLESLNALSLFIRSSSQNKILNDDKYQDKLKIHNSAWDYGIKLSFEDTKLPKQLKNEPSTRLTEYAMQVIGELNKAKTYQKKSYLDLDNSNLTKLDLSNRNYAGANMSYSDFTDSLLHGTNFNGAIMIHAIFTNSQIKQSCNWRNARYAKSDKLNQEKINQLERDKASNPEKPIDCSKWNSSIPSLGDLYKPFKNR
jgi:Pentapeptide repeats (8 copies)